ncbi:MAG: RING finger protein, partial [Acutalibacteraceae bacterium]
MTKIGYNTILIYYNYKEGAREMNYNNEICNGCGRKFSEGDDIVTCPECGTPQHRE